MALTSASELFSTAGAEACSTSVWSHPVEPAPEPSASSTTIESAIAMGGAYSSGGGSEAASTGISAAVAAAIAENGFNGGGSYSSSGGGAYGGRGFGGASAGGLGASSGTTAATAPSPAPRALTTDSRGASLRWAGGDIDLAAGLHTKEKGAKYEGEDERLGWREETYKMAGVGAPDLITTRYDKTPEKQARTKATIGAGGLLEDASGQIVDSAELGEHGFVMSGAGDVHLFDQWDHKAVSADGETVTESRVHPKNVVFNGDGSTLSGQKAEVVHHTTPLGGAAVAGAGTITAERGILSKLTDQSGHYAPEGEYTHQAVAALAAQGAAMERQVTTADGETGTKSMTVGLTGHKPWIADYNRGAKPGEQMKEGELELPYQAFLTSGGNEAQMRLKSTVGDWIKGTGGAANAGLKKTFSPAAKELRGENDDSDPLAYLGKMFGDGTDEASADAAPIVRAATAAASSASTGGTSAAGLYADAGMARPTGPSMYADTSASVGGGASVDSSPAPASTSASDGASGAYTSGRSPTASSAYADPFASFAT